MFFELRRLAKRVMEEIIVSGTVTRGELGFDGNALLERKGFLITRIERDGPADIAGLRLNDILLSINNTEVGGEDAAKALAMVADTTPGSLLTLVVDRGDQLVTLTVVVGAKAS